MTLRLCVCVITVPDFAGSGASLVVSSFPSLCSSSRNHSGPDKTLCAQQSISSTVVHGRLSPVVNICPVIHAVRCQQFKRALLVFLSNSISMRFMEARRSHFKFPGFPKQTGFEGSSPSTLGGAGLASLKMGRGTKGRHHVKFHNFFILMLVHCKNNCK